VIPSTLEQVTLAADILIENEAGQTELQRVSGESAITHANGRIQRVELEPANPRAYPPALKAIFQAEIILIGPGSLYTSILPNLLIPDLAQALKHARAPVVYICNLATQAGETSGYDVADHVRALHEHIPDLALDVVLANDNWDASPEVLGRTVFVPLAEVPGVRIQTADLLDITRPWRHDSAKLAAAVMALLSG
jgi:uncharacterized cofD-like protein